MSENNRTFYNTLVGLMVFLMLMSIAIFWFSTKIEADKLDEAVRVDYTMQQPVDERIRPIGNVQSEADAAAAAAEAAEDMGAGDLAVAEAPAEAPARGGQEVYDQACFTCHRDGITGAPKLGDTANWEPRLAQGADVLYDHAIQGYQGTTGYMPPKGGRVDFSDEEVRLAVDYMVAQSE